MTRGELGRRLGATLTGPDGPVIGFATDSREVTPGVAFLAIRGANVDGADHAPAALAAGASVVVAERPVDGPHIVVDDLAAALARLARSYRDAMTGPVVGITGSVGKTTARSFVAAALSPLGPVVATRGNRNSEWTGPLAWAEGPRDPAAAVVEMGMRGFGQIAHLARAHGPNVGLITNIGWAHLELVESREGIARAKAELVEALPADGVAILPAEDDFLPFLRDKAGARRVLTFGRENGDVRLTDVQRDGQAMSATFAIAGHRYESTVRGVARTSALAATMGLAVATAVGVDPEAALYEMSQVQPEALRMNVVEHHGRTILMDAYNAAPDSMRAALETLSSYPGPRYALLGAMRELGSFEADAHADLVQSLPHFGLQGVMLYAGPMIAAGGGRYSEGTTLNEARAWLAAIPEGAVVLVKGSRAWELERVLS